MLTWLKEVLYDKRTFFVLVRGLGIWIGLELQDPAFDDSLQMLGRLMAGAAAVIPGGEFNKKDSAPKSDAPAPAPTA